MLACSFVFLLFLLGGLVRVTGSGMGCPDWPKCFGLLAPPTCECQLPPDYMQTYLEKRLSKVERFAATLDAAGFHNKASQLRTDPNIVKPEEFNVFKAWMEYINRLFGVLAGLFGLAFFILSFRYVTSHGSITVMATLGLIMLLFNAWLGSIVVATNLLPGLITVHFLFSFFCMFFFMRGVHLHKPFLTGNDSSKLNSHWVFLFFLMMAEVILGTLARERVEYLEAIRSLEADGMLNLQGMGWLFAVHRFLPAAILVYAAWVFRRYRNTHPWQGKWFLYIAIGSLLQIALGAFNTVFILPPAAQVSHIVLGALMPVMLFYAWLAKPAERNSVTS